MSIFNANVAHLNNHRRISSQLRMVDPLLHGLASPYPGISQIPSPKTQSLPKSSLVSWNCYNWVKQVHSYWRPYWISFLSCSQIFLGFRCSLIPRWTHIWKVLVLGVSRWFWVNWVSEYRSIAETLDPKIEWYKRLWNQSSWEEYIIHSPNASKRLKKLPKRRRRWWQLMSQPRTQTDPPHPGLLAGLPSTSVPPSGWVWTTRGPEIVKVIRQDSL